MSIIHCIHRTLSQQPERVIRCIAQKMKDLDLNFNNVLEYLKKIQGIPEENLLKVEEFRKNQLLSLRQSAHIFLTICHCIHRTLSPQPERVIRCIARKMKDLDLNFNNMLEYLKKIQGIPEENLWKVEEFQENHHFH